MSGKRDKELRKETKLTKKQIKGILYAAIDSMKRQPFRIRIMLALQILLGGK